MGVSGLKGMPDFLAVDLLALIILSDEPLLLNTFKGDLLFCRLTLLLLF